MPNYELYINDKISLGDYSVIQDYVCILDYQDNITVNIENNPKKEVDIICNILKNEQFNIINEGEEKVNLLEFLKTIIKKYSLMMQNHDFITDIDIDSSPYSIFDSMRIEEVFNNFLTNAKRYTKLGDKIIVSLKNLNDNNFIISIENYGVRLNENDLTNIWDKFYRVDKSRNKSSGGSGLGLAITKRILDLHKSSYGVENTSNGVKFYFTLPRL